LFTFFPIQFFFPLIQVKHRAGLRLIYIYGLVARGSRSGIAPKNNCLAIRITG
jgi:hypothetical protein